MAMELPGLMRQALANPGSRSAFVVVNLAVNGLFLARSYIAMLVLDHRELGLLAVLQTVMAVVAAMHFGLLSGGYRTLCSESGESAGRINALIYSFIAALGAVGLLVGVAGFALDVWSVAAGFALLGAVFGVLTLLRSWVTNQLLASGRLAELNTASVKAVALSLLPLATIPWSPLAACVASFLLQPVVFALLALTRRPDLRPRSLEFSVPLFRALMRNGFLVFMTGVLLQLFALVERWYVLDFLGLEALGHLYLAIVFVTVFQLVPTSLDSVVLPRLVRDYESGDQPAARRELRRLFMICAGYCAMAALAVWLLADPVVRLLMPRYVEDLQYVYLVLPGLIALALAGPFGIVFNVLIRYNAFMVAYGGGFLLALAVFGFAAWQGGALDLQGVAATRTIVMTVTALLLVALYFHTVRYFPALALHRASNAQRS